MGFGNLRGFLYGVLSSLGSAGALEAATFVLPPRDVALVGYLQEATTCQEDTLLDIARLYNVGYQEIVLANPDVDPWLPGEGTRVLVPTRYILPDAPRKGIVLNLAEMRLYFYPKCRAGESPQVMTFPVSIGRGEWETPLGTTQVVKKVADPTWYPPKSIRAEHAAEGDPLPKVVPPGPDNPLGRFALRLGLPGYLIHGTNKPYGIGMKVSHGCVRLYPEDIEVLFREVPMGTPVRIVNQPYKTGWHLGVLYLEVHSPFGDRSKGPPQDLTPLTESLVATTRNRPDYAVDWDRVRGLARYPQGIPLAIDLSGVSETPALHISDAPVVRNGAPMQSHAGDEKPGKLKVTPIRW